MAREIELSRLDLRYESYRMKDCDVQGRLLSSIAQQGICQPLEGVEAGALSVLLNGFKRYRCARKLGIESVPYASLGRDEVEGIVSLLRICENKPLSIMEQARFIDELNNTRQMSVGEIAMELSRSKAWVSMRLSLIAEMSPAVQGELLGGRFPVYAYMYTLRRFMRMNGITGEQIEEFVAALSGKKLSLREIEQLAHGCFRGPESFAREILKGNLAMALEQIKEMTPDPQRCSEFERILLKDLEQTQNYMQRVMGKSQDPRIKSRVFHSQSHLITAGILSRNAAFIQTMKGLHDRNAKT